MTILRTLSKSLPGAVTAATLAFLFFTALDLRTGLPCNGTRIAELQELLVGPRCVDRFGTDYFVLATTLVGALLCGAVGAFLGTNRSPWRGALGTALGVAAFDLYMQSVPGELPSIRVLPYLAVDACISAAFGFLGGWIVRRMDRRPVEPSS